MSGGDGGRGGVVVVAVEVEVVEVSPVRRRLETRRVSSPIPSPRRTSLRRGWTRQGRGNRVLTRCRGKGGGGGGVSWR